MKNNEEELNQNIFVVTAYRWGEKDSHCYIIGASNDLDEAKTWADKHTAYRGGKYACIVDKIILNDYDDDKINYTEEVYKTKSVMCNRKIKKNESKYYF
ncbi:MAG: hypothetical protein ACOCVF_00760 [bacterium]